MNMNSKNIRKKTWTKVRHNNEQVIKENWEIEDQQEEHYKKQRIKRKLRNKTATSTTEEQNRTNYEKEGVKEEK